MIQLLSRCWPRRRLWRCRCSSRTPARRLALLAVDRAKRGRGPVMAKTVAGTMFIVLASSGYSIGKIRSRSGELAQLTPTDQVLASRHLLEASLMATVGFTKIGGNGQESFAEK
ncbi:hypothetical protein PR202_ga11661 [Eleusine coracana subsp. coracana]|uniref:Uncharacterized protein n=1 Tax=Eleusine coracana subsp. coracana TaxID=191504 RepID=A0AAV5C9Y2_ELECO|nr:hypothetical protein PR202_ga11661 [Eleusine coracana subsp. coracana]